MSKSLFMDAVVRRNDSDQTVFGTGTSIACQELMEQVGVWFPDAHLEAEKMADLASAGHTVLGFDVVMPLFSVCHEAAAMGCNVNWGGPDAMPESGRPIYSDADDIKIPDDFLDRPGCKVPLEAIAILKKRLGDDAAVCGKVFGSWTLAYHLFGVENFLIATIDDPDGTRRLLEKLIPVTLRFARAQIEAGADCLLLADHATRDLCSPDAYRDFLMEMHGELARQIEVPLILHICGDTADRIGMIAQTGLACFHWDTKLGPAEKARELAGDKLSLMGGISNYKLLKDAPETIAADAVAAVRADIDIIGPECAIPLTTPLANLKAIAKIGRNPVEK
ncbi:MAG: MtaA/CmuA family methyltransferase [Phycisphaerae bacterium]|nr:MtaA/CmuA family methyltransferase [Phycisphaerae bacterium]